MTDDEKQRMFDLWWGRVGKFDFERDYIDNAEEAIQRGFIAAIDLMLEKNNS